MYKHILYTQNKDSICKGDKFLLRITVLSIHTQHLSFQSPELWIKIEINSSIIEQP